MPLEIEVVGVANKELLLNVIEDGKTALENARKKALADARLQNEHHVYSKQFIQAIPWSLFK